MHWRCKILVEWEMRKAVAAFKRRGYMRVTNICIPRLERIDWLSKIGTDSGRMRGAIRIEDRESFLEYRHRRAPGSNYLDAMGVVWRYLSRLEHSHSIEYEDSWSEVFVGDETFPSIKAAMQVFVAKCANVLEEHGFDGDYAEEKIPLDLAGYASLTYFSELADPPKLHERLIAIYEAGHLPCGWAGDEGDWGGFGDLYYY